MGSGWVSLRDHYCGRQPGGVQEGAVPAPAREQKARPAVRGDALPAAQEYWVPWHDHVVNGVSRNRLLDSEARRKQPLPPPPPLGDSLPPEARVTVQQAVEQVFAPLRYDNPVRMALEKTQHHCRQQYNDGLMSEQQWRACQRDMSDIQLDYARRTDAVTHEFLDRFFRVFPDLDELAAEQNRKRLRGRYPVNLSLLRQEL
jgi:hypothetical protein